MKILHVAPLNVAGVPYNMMEMQRRFGHEARLVTLHRNTFGFPEDICADLPLPRNPLAHRWRDFKRSTKLLSLKISGHDPETFLPLYKPANILERSYFWFDDILRKKTIETLVERFRLDTFDVIHYDGGVDFFRDARLAKRWKKLGKKFVCHYMGSDLRVRGVHPVMDKLSDLNITNESDHLLRHPDIHYVYIPFDCSALKERTEEKKRLRIIHSPTNRAMKGTEFIIPVMEHVQKVRDVEFILVEHLPHEKVMEIKMTCDISIEQVGNLGGTGYGRNSLETLAMGIPTVTEMTADYLAWIPENPFVLATKETLFDRLIELIDHPKLRREYAKAGRPWVEKYHSYKSVHDRLMQLYQEHGIAG
jgi:glycosyltransferase involved in cell wall biosynthesis